MDLIIHIIISYLYYIKYNTELKILIWTKYKSDIINKLQTKKYNNNNNNNYKDDDISVHTS